MLYAFWVPRRGRQVFLKGPFFLAPFPIMDKRGGDKDRGIYTAGHTDKKGDSEILHRTLGKDKEGKDCQHGRQGCNNGSTKGLRYGLVHVPLERLVWM